MRGEKEHYRFESFPNGWSLDKSSRRDGCGAELGQQMKEEVNRARVLPL